MPAFAVRSWLPGDIPELKEIFAASFGDPPEVVDAFYRAFLAGPETCVVAAVPDTEKPEGRAVAAGYVLPGPALRFSDTASVPSVYLYALGCLPACRRRGYGMAVYRSMLARGKSMAPAECGIPASEALVQVYDRIHPMVPLGRSRIAEMSSAGASGAEPLAVEHLSWEVYAGRREQWLGSHPHAVYPESYYRLSAEFGSLFLALPGALAALIPLEGRCVVSELLCIGADPARAVAGIAAACPAEGYEIRTPAFFPGPGSLRRFAYYHDTAEPLPAPEDFWFPFGLE